MQDKLVVAKIQMLFSISLKYPGVPAWQTSLQWRHNERHGVSTHRRLDCLPNHLFRPISKRISKLRVTGLCERNPPVTGGFPSQRASNAENVSIRWGGGARSVIPSNVLHLTRHDTTWDIAGRFEQCRSIVYNGFEIINAQELWTIMPHIPYTGMWDPHSNSLSASLFKVKACRLFADKRLPETLWT